MLTSYCIYEAYCTITNKSYIGFDSKWPTRQKKHFKQYPKSKKHKKFYNAIKKYGWDAFIWTIIDQNIDGKYVKNILEPGYIKLYNSKNNGYNMTDGGDGVIGYNHTEETKKIIGQYSKGNTNTKGRKLSKQEMLVRKEQWLGEKNPNYGKTKENHPRWKGGPKPYVKKGPHGLKGTNHPNYGKKHPGIGGRKKGCIPWSKGLATIDNPLTKQYWLISPDNEKHLIKGIIGAEIFGIPQRSARNSLAKNQPILRGQFKGWQCIKH